jgi:hypothetical protein
MPERSPEAMRAAKDKLDRVVDDLADLEKIGQDYAYAQSAQAWHKAIKQAHKWAREARRAM